MYPCINHLPLQKCASLMKLKAVLISEYKNTCVEGSARKSQFRKIIAVGLPLGSMSSQIIDSTVIGITVVDMNFSSVLGLKSNQKSIGYPLHLCYHYNNGHILTEWPLL